MSNVNKPERRQAYIKGIITSNLKRLESLVEPVGAGSVASENLVFSLITDIVDKLKTIEEFTEIICLELSDKEMQDEVEKNCSYVFDVRTKISKYKDLYPSKFSDSHVSVREENTPSVKLPLPPINLDTFENNHSNPFAYFTFKKTFYNALAGIPNLTNAQKLIYLKNFVKGEALNVIEGIAVDDKGFKTAFDLLDFNFLNVEEIRDRTLDSVLSFNEARSLKEVEFLIRNVNIKLHDLKSLNLDLLEDNSAGLLLLSKIVCNKLPRHFLIELFRETKSNYPNFNQILKVYQSVLARLRVNSREDSSVNSKSDVRNNKHPNKSEGAVPKVFNKSVKPSVSKESSEKKIWVC